MIRMEIKADVHAVHPSGGPKAIAQGPDKACYGSWCSPEPTKVTRANSSSGSKGLSQDIINYNQRLQIELPKVRLQASQARACSPSDEIKEVDIELDDLEKPKTFKEHPSEWKNSSDPNEETPQSPVPTSPKKPKKFLSLLQLPEWCDPFDPIDPQGRGYIIWLLLMTCCYSYNCWCIVLRATFPYQTPENSTIWLAIDVICDLFYVVDVVFIKPRLMYLNEGFWVDDRKLMKKNYRNKLQFKYDVAAMFPLDMFYVPIFGQQMVILRLPRLLKLQTFWEFHQAMDRVLSSPYVVRIGKTLFYIFYLIHLNACAYYLISTYEGLGSNGFVYDNQGNAYIRCFYFATKTATSIGKNPKPENALEYMFMTVAWLMGVFVFALLIGQIRDIIATATRSKTRYRKTVDGCTRYLRKLNMPPTLQRRVTDWFYYTWQQQRWFDESNILNSLPYNMKRDVALEVHIKTLSKVQLFRDCSSSLLRDLVLQLRPVSCLPGDVVVRRGDVGHQMYIVNTGECCVMSDDDKEVVVTLREGSVFGEISLLGIDGLRRRTATVRSRGYSSLFALTRSDLDAALRQHKEATQVLRLRADQLIRENAERQTRLRLAEKQTRKSASTVSSGLRNRRVQSRLASVSSSGSKQEIRKRSASAQSKLTQQRRLSVLSENQDQVPPQNESAASSSVTVRQLPTIVFSSD